MGVAPDVETDRLALRAHRLFRRAKRAVEVPPPDQKCDRHAEKRGGRCARRPLFLALHPAHDANDRFAKEDQGKQTETLGQMSGVWRYLDRVWHREPRGSE